MLRKEILLLGNKKMFLPLVKKHNCFPNKNFASETYVSQFSRAGNMFRKQENVFASGQKHFCFPNTNFASQIMHFQFSHHKNNVD